MGVGYYQPLVHWSKGEYTGATSTQDDMSIIQGYVPGRVDDVSDSTTAAVALPLPADTVGLVSTRVDVDTHRIVLPAGDVSLDARPSAVSPNLDLKLQELASDGSVFARSNPPGWMLLP